MFCRFVVAKGERRWSKGRLGVWDQQTQNINYRLGKQLGPTVEHRVWHVVL